MEYDRGLTRCYFPSARRPIESSLCLTLACDYLSHRRDGMRVFFFAFRIRSKYDEQNTFNFLALACYIRAKVSGTILPAAILSWPHVGCNRCRSGGIVELSNLALLRPRPHVSQLDSDHILICPSRRNIAQSSREAVR